MHTLLVQNCTPEKCCCERCSRITQRWKWVHF